MEIILKSLKIAIFDVIEKMFFLLPDESNGLIPDISDSETVYIGITGNPAYLVTLIYDKNLAVTMSADLLGLDKDKVDTSTILETIEIV